jgi:hypothetical protein
VDFPLKNKLSLQTGLLYKMNGYRMPIYAWSYPAGMQYVTINTLEVPVKLVRYFNRRKGARFFVGAGPYVAVNIAASSRVHTETYDAAGNPVGTMEWVQKIDIGSRWTFVQRMDAGVGMNAGYMAAKGLLIGLQAQYGLLNLGDAHNKVHNYNFGLVAGYSFKLKKHKAHSEEPAGAKQ